VGVLQNQPLPDVISEPVVWLEEGRLLQKGFVT
jgi:hypothetical protein